MRLQNEIIRKERIPLDVVREVNDEVFQGIAGIIKASGLPVDAVNKIFAQLRRLGENMMRGE